VLFEVRGTPPNDFIGLTLAGPGDLNGDDFPDLVIGRFHDRRVSIVRAFSGAPNGITTIGTACPSPNGTTPRIGASRTAKTGTTFGLPGCFLRVAPDVLLGAVTTGRPGRGHASLSLAIPNDTSLAGTFAFAQWLWFAPGPVATPLSTTRALSIQLR
jgi:hypothetical protein